MKSTYDFDHAFTIINHAIIESGDDENPVTLGMRLEDNKTLEDMAIANEGIDKSIMKNRGSEYEFYLTADKSGIHPIEYSFRLNDEYRQGSIGNLSRRVSGILEKEVRKYCVDLGTPLKRLVSGSRKLCSDDIEDIFKRTSESYDPNIIISDADSRRFLSIAETMDEDFADCYDVTEFRMDSKGSPQLYDGGVYYSLDGIEDEFDMDHLIQAEIEPITELHRPVSDTLYARQLYGVRYDIKTMGIDESSRMSSLVHSKGLMFIGKDTYEDVMANEDLSYEEDGLAMVIDSQCHDNLDSRINVSKLSPLMKKICSECMECGTAYMDADMCSDMGLGNRDILNLQDEADGLGLSYLDIEINDAPDLADGGRGWVVITHPGFTSKLEFADNDSLEKERYSDVHDMHDDRDI